MCDWTTDYNTEFMTNEYKLVQGKDLNGDAIVDHTTQTEYGHFLQSYNGIKTYFNALLKKFYE